MRIYDVLERAFYQARAALRGRYCLYYAERFDNGAYFRLTFSYSKRAPEGEKRRRVNEFWNTVIETRHRIMPEGTTFSRSTRSPS